MKHLSVLKVIGHCLMNSEIRFFFDVLGALAGDREPPVLSSETDWSGINRLAVRHGVAGVFSHYYGQNDQVPLTFRRSWKDSLMSVLFLNERSLKATVKVLRILEMENVPVVVLRGMALAYTIYPEPYLRAMQDVDLLIKSDSKERLLRSLSKHGFDPSKRLRGQFVYQINGTEIEVHWSFLTPKRYRNMADFDKWIDTSKVVSNQFGNLRCLSAENELLELVCHSFIHHELSSVQSLIDMARLLRSTDIDWVYVRSWCEGAGISRLFYFTLTYVDHLFDLNVSLPSGFSERLITKDRVALFDAYTAVLIDADNRWHFLRRKRNLLHVAERLSTKLKQLIRFTGDRELKSFSQMFFGDGKHAGIEVKKKRGERYCRDQ